MDNWREVVALKAAGQDVSQSPWTLPDWIEKLNADSSPTDYASTILGMLAAEQDPTQVGDRNLVTELAAMQNNDGSFGTALNATIWAMIALDAAGGSYDADKAVGYLVRQQKSDGGFALSGDRADPDITGMALLALARHRSVTGVSEAITRAINCLKQIQLPSGGFARRGGEENPESTASVILGLLACGEKDFASDEWQREQGNPIDALFSFQLEDGSFCHSKSYPTSDPIATAQALHAVAEMVNAGIDYTVEAGQGGTGSQPAAATVRVRVEGATRSLADETVTISGTALEALMAAVGEDNVQAPDGFVTGILGESSSAVSENLITFWTYYVIRGGSIEPTAFSVGPAGFSVRDGDEVVFYIAAYDSRTWASKTYLPVVTVSPQPPKAGQAVTISVTAKKYDWVEGLIDLPPEEAAAIGEYTVTVGSEQYQTRSGQVTIPNATAGNLCFTITNQSDDGSYPEVVTYKGAVRVEEATPQNEQGTTSGSGGGGATTTSVVVQVAVVGASSEFLFEPSYVAVSNDNPWGLTALGALDATGLGYEFSWYGDSAFVTQIAGQANEGYSGWCYGVNDSEPSKAANQRRVYDGDRVVWYYNVNFSTSLPKWADLLKRQSRETSSATEALSAVQQALSGLQTGGSSPGQTVTRLEEILSGLKADQVTAELKTKLAETTKLLAEILAELPDEALVT
ncbi:MAG: DUF4430 domain-containing protein, partial [Moorellales bacterium]